LQPVLETLQWLKNETNVWFEITNLIIPTLNDAAGETRALAAWVLEHLGPDVPLHFTAFHPDFKLRDKPRTPPGTLHAARRAALDAGLHFVYEGNVHSDGSHTACPSCGTIVIRRSWHDVLQNRLAAGRCPECGNAIAGRWTNDAAQAQARISRESVAASDDKYGELNL